MEAAAQRVLSLSRGRVALLPLVFFVLAALLAMVGPGAILSVALLAPMAMRTGVPVGISPFLIALMIGNGANAGNLSPFSSIAVALGAYLLFGGLGLSWRTAGSAQQRVPRLTRPKAVSLAALFLWMAVVIVLRWPLGWTALGFGAALLLFSFAPWRVAVAKMPWKVIAMVVTISTAVGFIEQAGGLQWFQAAVSNYATPLTVHPLLAFLTGIISAYSSTSSVVLPAFLPMVPGIAARLPGTDALALAISINIGSAMVDVSPLSTIGALCIAAAPEGSNKPQLFTRLMIWGFAMAFVAAGICYLASPWFPPTAGSQ